MVPVRPLWVPPGRNEILWTIQDAEGHVMEHLKACDSLHVSHATASHTHRLVVGDTYRHDLQSPFAPEEVTNALYLLDRETREAMTLCACNSSFISHDEEGRPVYSEYLYPRPIFSPDDKHVLFDSDFQSGTAQLHLVEL